MRYQQTVFAGFFCAALKEDFSATLKFRKRLFMSFVTVSVDRE